jgi:hypothetical protein
MPVYPVNENTIVELTGPFSEVQVATQNFFVESTTQPNSVEIVVQNATIYTAGFQGPAGADGLQGPQGEPGEEVPYSTRVDWISDSELYKGEADPGSSESSAVWRIRHIVIGNDDDVTTNWADGDSQFDNIWANRASLSYS